MSPVRDCMTYIRLPVVIGSTGPGDVCRGQRHRPPDSHCTGYATALYGDQNSKRIAVEVRRRAAACEQQEGWLQQLHSDDN
jgi:hypothetical protein